MGSVAEIERICKYNMNVIFSILKSAKITLDIRLTIIWESCHHRKGLTIGMP